MIYGYIRVSSDKQTVENQRFEINNFCLKENMHIDGWIEETISGTKNYDKKNNPKRNTSNLEHEIDRFVYQLYGLTEGGDCDSENNA